jgi:hypothetical protein
LVKKVALRLKSITFGCFQRRVRQGIVKQRWAAEKESNKINKVLESLNHDKEQIDICAKGKLPRRIAEGYAG